MSPERVLQVLGRLDRGGAETMIMNLYRHFNRSRIQLDFVIHTEDECDYSAEVRSLGAKIYNMKPFNAVNSLGYRRQWRDFFAKHKGEYRLIHAHMRSTASIFLDEAGKAGLTTIAHSHNTSSGTGLAALVKDYLQKGITKKADVLMACSERSGFWLYGEKACKGDNFYILNNGIDTNIFTFDNDIRDRKRRELLSGADAPIFLHVGRFEEQKNHRFLLQIMSEPAIRESGTLLYLCGSGPLEDEIRSAIKNRGLEDRVFILGVRQDINELMMGADLMLFPSLYEGLPVTLIEAQAAGLPVLMSDRVDGEAVVTDMVEELSLNAEKAIWAGKALEMLKRYAAVNRKSPLEAIKRAGYDAAENAIWLQDFYTKLIHDML